MSKEKKKKMYMVFGIILFILTGFLIYSCIKKGDEILIEADGFQATFVAEVKPINRFDHITEESMVFDGFLLPVSSALPITHIYLEDFNDQSSDWSVLDATFGYASNLKYEGTYSCYMNTEASVNSSLFYDGDDLEIDDLNTTDIIFYIRESQYLTNGFRKAFVNITYDTTQTVSLTYLLENTTTYYPNENEVLVQEDLGFTRNVWNGIYIEDIRAVLEDYNSSINGINYNITAFGMVIKDTATHKLYLDYAQVDERPFVYTDFWFINDEAVTDWQVTVSYTVKIDSTLIADETEFALRILLYSWINSSVIVDPFYTLAESVILSNLAFEDYSEGNFDRKAEGNYQGVLHTLPDASEVGETIDYKFAGYFEGYGELVSGGYTQASSNSTLPSSDFTLEWKEPAET